MAECTHCHHEFKTKYANITGLLRIFEAYASKHKYMYVEKKLNRYETKIVKSKDITEGIARMIYN